MLNSAPFLQIALLKLRALFALEPQARIAQSGVHITLNLLPIYFLSLPQYSPFLRPHLHPALGISPKDLSIFRRHCDPALA